MTESVTLLPRTPEDMQPDRMAAMYRRLREAGPTMVPIAPDNNLLVVGGYADVRGAIRNPALSNRLTLAPLYHVHEDVGARIGRFLPKVPANTAGSDGELHARARRGIMATFPTGLVGAREQMLGLVQPFVQRMIGGIAVAAAVDREVDVMPHIWSLPLMANAKILGFDASKEKPIKEAGVGQIGLVWGSGSYKEQMRGIDGLESLWAMSEALVAEYRLAHDAGQPRQDFIGKLLSHMIERNPQLSKEQIDAEIASIVMNFSVAGHETTANSIANGLRYMMDHPEVWDMLKQHPERMDDVVLELLRLCPSIYGWSRWLPADAEPTMIGDVEVAPGTRILLLLGAANRDPAEFGEDADIFRLGRDRLSQRILTFGATIPKRPEDSHYCPGAALARVVMAEAYRALIEHFPNMQRSTAQPGYAHNLGFQTMNAYLVRPNR